MKAKLNSSIKLHGKVTIEQDPIPVYTQIHAEVYPNGRYPGGIGGQTWRIMTAGAEVNGKTSYYYGDEVISWSSENNRWEIINLYSGVISFSPENVLYPYLVQNWYYGANILDSEVDVYGI